MSAEAVTIPVALGARAYEVVIGPGLLAGAGARLARDFPRRRLIIVSDRNLAERQLTRLRQGLDEAAIRHETIILDPGEGAKSFAGLERLCEALLALKAERSDLIVAFGGGVIGDLAGFAAAILKRGVDFIQIPTTLLAQVDSSVGGKTAINARHGKNMIGAFHQPRLVLADTALLDTLPARELRAGYAEVVKYGLLGDAAFFDWLDGSAEALLGGDDQARIRAIARSVEMKAEIVAEDERETGRRALLNLGHTFGHALEAETGFGEALLHGEAVALGMVQAFDFSVHLGLCAPEAAARARAHLARLGLPTDTARVPGGPFPPERLVEHMAQDKKVSDGRLTFILARGIGDAFIAKDVSADAVLAFLRGAPPARPPGA